MYVEIRKSHNICFCDVLLISKGYFKKTCQNFQFSKGTDGVWHLRKYLCSQLLFRKNTKLCNDKMYSEMELWMNTD